MSDPEQEFWQTVKRTVARLQQRDRQTLDYNGHQGWSVDRRHKTTERGKLGGWYEEYTESADLVLKTDGTFLEVGQWYTEGSEGDSPVHKTENQVSSGYFVGTSGRPFQEWTEKLERFGYR